MPVAASSSGRATCRWRAHEHNATRLDFKFPTLFGENVLPDPYAASGAMYDVITLFALVGSEHSLRPREGGRAHLNLKLSIGTTSFAGVTGSVKLDTNGDLLLSYEATSLLRKNGTLQSSDRSPWACSGLKRASMENLGHWARLLLKFRVIVSAGRSL